MYEENHQTDFTYCENIIWPILIKRGIEKRRIVCKKSRRTSIRFALSHSFVQLFLNSYYSTTFTQESQYANIINYRVVLPNLIRTKYLLLMPDLTYERNFWNYLIKFTVAIRNNCVPISNSSNPPLSAA